MKVAQSMSILFWLRPTRSEATPETYIMARVTINGKRAEWSLGRKVNPAHWVSGAGLVKSGVKDASITNNYLTQIRGQIQQAYNILLSQADKVTPEMVKNVFLGKPAVEAPQRKTMLEAFDYHNAKFKERAMVGKVSLKSHKRLEICRGKVEAFMTAVLKVSDKPLDEVRLSFVTEFEHFLAVNQKLQSNTSMKYVKILKQVMNFAVGLDWIPSNPFQQFKCTYTNPDRDVLTQAEIDAIYLKKLPNTRLEQVRDVFIFACYTGFAFSDIEKLDQNAVTIGIDGEYWIQTNRVKTDTAENVMLLAIPLEIIEKYRKNDYCIIRNRLLPVISNQRYNSYLKEITDLCGIKKHLTSHIARHTFATTVTLANGVSLESVSAMLGHKNIRTTQIYAKVAQTKLSAEMKILKEKFKKSDLRNIVNS